MPGFAKAGTVITSGSNLAIAGVKPSGVAVQGNVVYGGGAPEVVWQLINSVLTTADVATSPPTSTPIDTTGASLIIIAIGSGTVTTVNDYIGNSYNLSVYQGQQPTITLAYCINPITSTAHRFTISGGAVSFVASAFKCTAIPLVDQQSILAPGTTLPITVPSITPSSSNSLFVTGAVYGTGELTIDSNFQIVGFNPGASGVAWASEQAYLVSSNAASPTWSSPVENTGRAVMMNFIPVTSLPWQLLSVARVNNPFGTTPPIDTTGATLLVAVGSYYAATLSGLSDNQNNTWSLAVDAMSGGGAYAGSVFYYCLNPTTSTAHTISYSPVGYSSFMFAAFSGPKAVLDQISSNSNGANIFSLPSNPITPSAANSLIISTVAINGSAAAPNTGIDSNFQIALTNLASGSNNSGAIAYLVQDTPVSVAPTWNWAPGNGAATTMASFIPS